MVHLEERERLGGHILGDGAVAAHLGPVAHALQQAVGQTRVPGERRAISRAPSSSMATFRIEADRHTMSESSSGV